MYSLNRAQIIGNLTEDPQIRQLPSGVFVADLNLEIKSQAGEQISRTFLTVTLWRKMAEIARDYIKQGAQVYVSGRLETDSWEDDKGNKRSKTKMTAEDLIILTPKSQDLPSLGEDNPLSTGLNRADLIGNVTREIELRTTPQGKKVTSLSIATNRNYKDQNGEMQEKAEFHNVVLWEELAIQVANHIPKGRKIFISGRVQTRSWESSTGEKRYTTEIIADSVRSLGHPYEAGSSSFTKPAAATTSTPAPTTDTPEISYESEIKPEDLPF